VEGDVIVGNRSIIEYGVSGNTIIIGEGVSVSGDVAAGSDARIDMWSKFGSNVDVGKNAYLGEFVAINGKLTVEGDLDVGKEVKIKSGFEAKGWIVVRNPVPTIMFLFLYIREMMHLGKGEEVEKALEELFEGCEDSPELGEKIFIVPGGTRISQDSIEVEGEAVIGNGCRLIGNLKAQSAEIGKGFTLQGSIYSEGKITVGDNSTVHGSLVSKGQVHLGRNCRVFGEIEGDYVFLHESSRVEGMIKAPFGVSFLRDPAGKTGNWKPAVQKPETEMEADTEAERKTAREAATSPDGGLATSLEIVEIETLMKRKSKAKNCLVPGRGRMPARTRAIGRSRRFMGAQRLR